MVCDMKKLIKLMIDYGCYPLWEYDENRLIGSLNPGSLRISQELVNEINDCGDRFENTLCMDDPRKTVFKTDEESQKFKMLGETIAKKLKEELGEEYQVIYQT